MDVTAQEDHVIKGKQVRLVLHLNNLFLLLGSTFKTKRFLIEHFFLRFSSDLIVYPKHQVRCERVGPGLRKIKVHVSNLPLEGVSDDDLADHFSQVL